MFRKLSLATGLGSSSGPGKDGKHQAGFQGKVVKYTPYSARHLRDDDDLDEVAVISNAAPENVRYGGGGPAANGPRVVPGIITSAGPEKSHVLSAIPYQPKFPAPSSSGVRRPSLAGTAGTSPPPAARSDAPPKPKPLLRDDSDISQPLIETISSRVGPPPASSHSQQSSQPGMQATANGGRGTGPGRPAPSNAKVYQHRPSCGTLALPNKDAEQTRKARDARRREIKREFEKWDSVTGAGEKSGCNWSFVFDPSGRLCYYWSMIVSLAFLYNSWVIMYRFAFEEINERTMAWWLSLDGIADFIYILDIAVHFRTGYLEEGVLQTEGSKLRAHYMNSTMFYIDCLCLLPLDFLYLSIGFNSMLRCFRLVKIYRFWSWLDRTERHTNYPNIFRTISLSHYILAIFHWNACVYHLISVRGGFGSSDWFTGSRAEECTDIDCDYLHAFYWSTLALTTIGDLPRPRTKSEYLFLIIELVAGLFMLATVLGHVANIVTNVSAARKEFQAKLDAVKTYMRMRRVPEHLKIKVIKWFDYLWMTQKSSDEDKSVGFLPAKLKAEIAIHVHLDTLKRVEIFQNTEAGFLCALVLRLRPVLFSPGDYVCRKGEVGKEMYIVNRGKLQVVTDNGKTVLATLRAGSYFGEISILNMGTAGNRRTASVRSVGYSDLFCLFKTDMWDVLKDYPAARVRLEAIAVKRLEKYRKDPLKKISMGRSRSTPGLLVELKAQGAAPCPSSDGSGPPGHGPSTRVTSRVSASAGTLLTEDHDEADEQDPEPSTAHAHGQPSQSQHSSSGNIITASGVHHEPTGSESSRSAEASVHCAFASSSGHGDHGLQHMAFMTAPSFGLTPATPTLHSQAQHQAQNAFSPQVPPMPAQYFLATTLQPHPGCTSPVPSQWYERRTSQPQTPHEATSATILTACPSPLPGYPRSPDHASLVAFRAISPAQSAPTLAPHLLGLVPPPGTPSGRSSQNEPCSSGQRSPCPGQSGSIDGSQDIMVAEIKRLRERLVSLETENATMSIKLSQQQWDVENRLAEIELQICSGERPEAPAHSSRPLSSPCSTSGDSESERNRESVI